MNKIKNEGFLDRDETVSVFNVRNKQRGLLRLYGRKSVEKDIIFLSNLVLRSPRGNCRVLSGKTDPQTPYIQGSSQEMSR